MVLWFAGKLVLITDIFWLKKWFSCCQYICINMYRFWLLMVLGSVTYFLFYLEGSTPQPSRFVVYFLSLPAILIAVKKKNIQEVL